MNKEELFDPVTAPGHAWVCSAATIEPNGILTLHRAYAGLPGNERFTPCGFRSADFNDAHHHADIHAGSHWVFEHPKGDIELFPRRSMHGSDGGGAYIDAVEEWLSDSVLRTGREHEFLL